VTSCQVPVSSYQWAENSRDNFGPVGQAFPVGLFNEDLKKPRLVILSAGEGLILLIIRDFSPLAAAT
jgi:hypothetical protein